MGAKARGLDTGTNVTAAETLQTRSVMDTLSRLAMGESLPGERRHVSAIESAVRLSSASFDKSESRANEEVEAEAEAVPAVSHFMPLTMLEMLAYVGDEVDITFPAATITGPMAATVTKMSLSRMDSRIFGTDQDDFNTHPIRMQYLSDQDTCETGEWDDDQPETTGNNTFTFTLNHRAAMTFPRSPPNSTVVGCPSDGTSVMRQVDCPTADGLSTYVLDVPCHGRHHYRGSGFLNISCPDITTTSRCSVKERSYIGYASVGECHAVMFGTHSTVCECALQCTAESRRLGAERRHLQQSSATAATSEDIDPGSVGMAEVVAITDYIITGTELAAKYSHTISHLKPSLLFSSSIFLSLFCLFDRLCERGAGFGYAPAATELGTRRRGSELLLHPDPADAAHTAGGRVRNLWQDWPLEHGRRCR